MRVRRKLKSQLEAANAKASELAAVQSKLRIEEGTIRCTAASAYRYVSALTVLSFMFAAKTRFLDSVTGTYPTLKYMFITATAVDSPALNARFAAAEAAVKADAKSA